MKNQIRHVPHVIAHAGPTHVRTYVPICIIDEQPVQSKTVQVSNRVPGLEKFVPELDIRGKVDFSLVYSSKHSESNNYQRGCSK